MKIFTKKRMKKNCLFEKTWKIKESIFQWIDGIVDAKRSIQQLIVATRTQSNGICVNLFFHFDLLHHHHFGLMVDFSVRSMAAIVISTQCTVMEPSTLHRISLHTKKLKKINLPSLCSFFVRIFHSLRLIIFPSKSLWFHFQFRRR